MKRIFACLFIVAVLPLMTSSSQHGSWNSEPFATIAFAGHSMTSGLYCNGDPGPDGICPVCGTNFNLIRVQEEPAEDSSLQRAPSVNAEPSSDSDPGLPALLFLVALMAWSRICT